MDREWISMKDSTNFAVFAVAAWLSWIVLALCLGMGWGPRSCSDRPSQIDITKTK